MSIVVGASHERKFRLISVVLFPVSVGIKHHGT